MFPPQVVGMYDRENLGFPYRAGLMSQGGGIQAKNSRCPHQGICNCGRFSGRSALRLHTLSMRIFLRKKAFLQYVMIDVAVELLGGEFLVKIFFGIHKWLFFAIACRKRRCYLCKDNY